MSLQWLVGRCWEFHSSTTLDAATMTWFSVRVCSLSLRFCREPVSQGSGFQLCNAGASNSLRYCSTRGTVILAYRQYQIQTSLLPDTDYLPIVGDWNGDCRDVSTRRWAQHTTPLGLQSAPRSLAHLPGAAGFPVSAVYHEEVVLESCRWRGYIPAGETYALSSLFTPRSYLAAVAESESEVRTTHYTLHYSTRRITKTCVDTPHHICKHNKNISRCSLARKARKFRFFRAL